jgi:predicted ArsR family transcriptional regulator
MPSLDLRILQKLVDSEEPLTAIQLSKVLTVDLEEVVLALSKLVEDGLVAPQKVACLMYWHPTSDGKECILSAFAQEIVLSLASDPGPQ